MKYFRACVGSFLVKLILSSTHCQQGQILSSVFNLCKQVRPDGARQNVGLNLYQNCFTMKLSPKTHQSCHYAIKMVRSMDSMYIFRDELELVCLVIGEGGCYLRLFIWGFTVDASRNLGSCTLLTLNLHLPVGL